MKFRGLALACLLLGMLSSCHKKAPAKFGDFGPTRPGVQTIVAGTNITVNATDPRNPIVSASGGGSSDGGTSSSVKVAGTLPIVADAGVDGSTTTYTVKIAAATSSVAGSMSAADKAFIDAQAWQRAAYAFCLARAPAITGYRYVAFGQDPNASAFATSVADGTVEGGGVAPGTGTVGKFGASVFQNTSGGNWCYVVRAKFSVPATSSDSEFGVINAGNTHQIEIAELNSVDTTHYIVQIIGTGTTNIVSTAVVDTAFHDFAVTDDGTTVTFWVDTVSKGSTATRTNLTTEPMAFYMFRAAAAGTVVAAKVAYGFVAP